MGAQGRGSPNLTYGAARVLLGVAGRPTGAGRGDALTALAQSPSSMLGCRNSEVFTL